MNELRLNGTQDFMGIKIPIIEGGFGEKQKCISDKTIAKLHNQSEREIRRRISDNMKRFKENIDFIDLTQRVGDAHSLELLNELGYSKQAIVQSAHIYILSERGYAKLIKIMDTDKAWEIHDELMDQYFNMRTELNSVQQHKATLLLSIYNGGQEGILASRELTKIEIEEATLPLKQEITQQQETISIQDNTITEQKKEIKTMKPKANYFDIVMQCKDLVSTTDIAKDYGWSAIKLNNFLKNNKIQYKRGNTWYLYQKYSEKGYSSTKTNVYYGKDGQDHAKVHMYWTQKGRLFIYKVMKDAGYLPLIEQNVKAV